MGGQGVASPTRVQPYPTGSALAVHPYKLSATFFFQIGMKWYRSVEC
jgi:hypothetical protein